MNEKFESKEQFTWTSFYMEFADRLLEYKNNRKGLLDIVKSSYVSLNMKYPFVDNGADFEDICPFTVFGCFNKGITQDNRIALLSLLGNKIGVKSKTPTEFDGIPVLNNMRAWFFGYKKDQKIDDISNLWDLFEVSLKYADEPSEKYKSMFISYYDKVRKQLGIKWNITMGLFWIRPYSYINLDELIRNYLSQKDNSYSERVLSVTRFRQLLDAKTYLELITICKTVFDEKGSEENNFPELSYNAWKFAVDLKKQRKPNASFLKWFKPIIEALKHLNGSATPDKVRNQIIADLKLSDKMVNETRGVTGVKKFDNEVAFARNYLAYDGYIDKTVRGVWTLTQKGLTAPMDEGIAGEIFLKWAEIMKQNRENETKYWIYAPGANSSKWDEFYPQEIMGIEWDGMGNLNQYKNKESMKAKMKELYGDDVSYRNDVLATWQFVNVLKIGDIVFVKKGVKKLIGRGVVQGEYIFDYNRKEYKHIRKIKWTDNGEWDYPGKAPVKTLTDITTYNELVKDLEELFLKEVPTDDEPIYPIPQYTKEDFLDEVFMGEAKYDILVNLLKNKKNLIIQGAPGVGKSFMSKRLAYSIIGEMDSNRVMMIQFHQSYSYEDFIMGFRPSKDGFELTNGPFYEFCKLAEEDDENDYFFIIDEINRGNLSKIFGELLMLIENDKRGEKLRLIYSNELFSVPDNLYIIGLMNTADRSLAMIDYALRRRFAFFDLEPAFDSDGFEKIISEANHEILNDLVESIKELNEFISDDESLGMGFRIGHSYLCTENEITNEWLESVVEYEILPLLKEYWFDEQSKVEAWTKKLKDVLYD